MSKTAKLLARKPYWEPSKMLSEVWECVCGNVNSTGGDCLKCGKSFTEARQQALKKIAEISCKLSGDPNGNTPRCWQCPCGNIVMEDACQCGRTRDQKVKIDCMAQPSSAFEEPGFTAD